MMTWGVKSQAWHVGSQDNTLLAVLWVQAGGAAGVVHESGTTTGSISASCQSPDQVGETEPVHSGETRYGWSVPMRDSSGTWAAPFPTTLKKQVFDEKSLLLNILKWEKRLAFLFFLIFAI